MSAPLSGRARQWWQSLAGIALLAALGVSVFASLHAQAISPNVKIIVDLSRPTLQSDFSPGISLVDTTLDASSGADPQAIARATSLMRGGVAYQNTPIMGWGLPDPWPDPSTPLPTVWEPLDARLQSAIAAGAIPVITLCEAPWWMKGQLQSSGATTPLTRADEWGALAYTSRIMDNKMEAWLALVRSVAERYMAPPYNVRYFQVWNELKGYYNPITNSYDYSTSPGNPGGPNARHGYTYMYNRVYETLLSVAAQLDIPTDQVRVGGPYVVMDTWSTPLQSNPSSLIKAYGTFDQRPLDVVKYWLSHKLGAGFITIDASGSNKDGVNIATATVAAGKFADIVRWIRSLDERAYPGATTLPIWLAEWNARPFTDWRDTSHNAAVKTYAMMEFMKAGGGVALTWGSAAVDASSPQLWTNTVRGGGQPLPFYTTYRDFREFFGPGVQLYEASVSPPGKVDVVASTATVMIVNLTAKPLKVSVDGRILTLQPYQITTIRTAVS